MSPQTNGTYSNGKGGGTKTTTLCVVLIAVTMMSLAVTSLKAEASGQPDSSQDRLSPYWGGAISQWTGWIVYWANQRELDPDLVAAVIRKESIGHATAEGPSGSVGLMMVLPAEKSGMSWRPSAEELKQPNLNLRWGTGMLKEIIRESDGDLFHALAAYNGGWEQVHLDSTRRYAHSVLAFYAYAIAGRHGYSYQESKDWELVILTREDGRVKRFQAHTSGNYLVPCFERALQFRQLYPEMVDAPRTRVAHYIDETGHEVLVDAWLFINGPDTPSNDMLVNVTPPEIPRIGHRP